MKEKIIPFDEFMEYALYSPEKGYYFKKQKIFGKNGDYYTSTNVSFLFGKTIANAILEYYRKEKIKPLCLECGAGEGYLALDILNYFKEKKIFKEFNYYILEKSPSLKKIQRKRLKIFTNVYWIEEIRSLKDFEGIVLFIEFFDAFPVKRIKKEKGNFFEIFVHIENKKIKEVFIPLQDSSPIFSLCKRFSFIPDGYSFEIPIYIMQWLKNFELSFKKGKVIIIDYGYKEKDLIYYPEGTIRSFYKHKVEENFYKNIGDRDITSSCNFTLLEEYFNKSGFKKEFEGTQENFLIENGILEIFEEEKKKLKREIEIIKLNACLKTLIHPSIMGKKFRVFIFSKE